MMIHIVLFCLVPQIAPAPDATRPLLGSAPSQTPPKVQDDPEYLKRKQEAGQDVTKLWKLYEWCRDNKKDKEGKATLKQILKLDPNHHEANVAAGNIFFDGKWFANEKKIEEYKKEQELKAKKDQGLVEWKGQWVPKEDVPFLEKGLVKDDSGNWMSGEDAKKLKEGYVKQDLDWIPPTEKENIGKGLWKCGDKWLSLADADKYHSDIDQWWRIPFDRYVVHTTCDRDLVTNKMKRQLDQAIDDLEKIYATKTKVPINVVVLRSLDQYNDFAKGNQDEQRAPADTEGLSSAHYAFFGDIAVDPVTKEPLSAGIAFWDSSSEDENKWGVHRVRHAIAQSFAEAIDPSPKALAHLPKSNAEMKTFTKNFNDEKRIPRWLRYGVAGYVERYYTDIGVPKPHWTREWSVSNILKAGGMRQLKQIFDFNLNSGSGQDGGRLINEAGLVVAFMVDSNTKSVSDKLKVVQDALKAGKDKKIVEEAVKALETEVIKNEAELKKFAGI